MENKRENRFWNSQTLLGLLIAVFCALVVLAWFVSNNGQGYGTGQLNRMAEKERVALTRFKWEAEKVTLGELENEKLAELQLLTWSPYRPTLTEHLSDKKKEGGYQSGFEGVTVESVIDLRDGIPTVRVSYYDVPQNMCERLVEKVLHPINRPYRVNGALGKCQNSSPNKLDVYFNPLQE